MTTENESQTTVDKDGFLNAEQNPGPENASSAGPQTSAPTSPAPKRRGRPPKNANLTAEQIEAGGASATAAAPKKKAAAKKAYTAADAGLMAKQLVGLHQMVAMISGFPEAMISEGEGKVLADAIVNISEQYELAIDGKTGAMIQLLGAAAMVYVPRAVAANSRLNQQKAQRGITVPANSQAQSVNGANASAH